MPQDEEDLHDQDNLRIENISEIMCVCFVKQRNLEKHKDFWRGSNHLRRGRFSVWFSMLLAGCMSKRTGTVQRKVQFSVKDLHVFAVSDFSVDVFSSDRFAVALQQFSNSLQMVKNQITPGKLTWPLTKEIVKETQPDYFKVCVIIVVLCVCDKLF